MRGRMREGETEEQGGDVVGEREGKEEHGNDRPLVDSLAVETVWLSTPSKHT